MKTKEEILANKIEKFPSDGIMTDEAIKRNVCKAMDEYAKQQAVEFIKWAIEKNKILGDNWGDAYMPGDEADVYAQFIESQTPSKQ